MKSAWLLAAALMLVVTGCGGSKGAVESGVSEPAPPPMAAPVVDEVEDVGGDDMATPVAPAPVRGPSASEISRQLRDIHFDFDKSVIREADKATLRANARLLNDNPQVSVVIEGHCDERGTTAYNLSLGERRAEATRSALLSLGVNARQLRTVSYGEEMPVCTRMDESCWAQNRRAHLTAN